MAERARIRALAGDEYLQMHEPAARYLFEGVRRFIDLSNQIDMRDVGFRSAKAESQASAAADLQRFHTYQFALASICGGVLQLADLGLSLCSRNTAIPESCREIATTPEMAKYCVGRDVHGLPLGAYVHAGRNQFAHWGDERALDLSEKWPAGFNKFTQGVFDRLLDVHYSDMFMDLVFELGNEWYGGTPNRAADIMFPILGWYEYQQYEADMKAMIG